LAPVREYLNVKERKYHILYENNNQLPSKYKESQGEIKDLKTKLEGNIYLIEDTQMFWEGVIQEVHSIWEYILIIPQENIMIRGS